MLNGAEFPAWIVFDPSGASTAIWIRSCDGVADKTAQALPPTVTGIEALLPKFVPMTFARLPGANWVLNEAASTTRLIVAVCPKQTLPLISQQKPIHARSGINPPPRRPGNPMVG